MSTTSSGRRRRRSADDVVAGDDALARRRAGEHDVGGGERVAEAVEADGAAADAPGEVAPRCGVRLHDGDRRRRRPCAARWRRRRPSRRRRRRARGGRRARRGGRSTISTAAWLIDDVPRPIAVSRAGPLADAQGVAEQQVERRAHAALVLGDLPRRAHLAEDLALAEHRRVEPGGDLEQVLGGGVVVLAVEVRVQLVGAQRRRARRGSRGCRRRRRGSARRRRRPRCGCTC